MWNEIQIALRNAKVQTSARKCPVIVDRISTDNVPIFNYTSLCALRDLNKFISEENTVLLNGISEFNHRTTNEILKFLSAQPIVMET